MLLLHVAIAVLIILFLIMKLELNPAMSLIIASIYYGLATGLGFELTVSTISSGFGNMMAGIGLSIGFGVMLGQLLAASGGIHAIANKLLDMFGEENAAAATAGTGFIGSIPVFYDVVYVIIIPIARGMSNLTGKTIALFVGALTAGALGTHMLVPPTPGPLALSEMLGIDLGLMIIAGAIVGIILVSASMYVYKKFFLDRGFFKPEEDIDHEAVEEMEETDMQSDTLPSFGASMFPILLPVILILIGTVTDVAMDTVPAFVTFLSDKVIALLIGALAAYVVASAHLEKEQVNKALSKAMSASGLVLLITGAGGSFAAILNESGVAGVIEGIVEGYSINIVLLAWLTAFILRIAQGSGTVAMLTTGGLMAPVLSSGNVEASALWVAIAIGTGGLCLGHVNDSGFWVTTKLSGLTTRGGLKTYTVMTGIMGILGLVIALLGSMIIPI
ncbi:MAG: GntP family permease [Bacillota bacterium]